VPILILLALIAFVSTGVALVSQWLDPLPEPVEE